MMIENAIGSNSRPWVSLARGSWWPGHTIHSHGTAARTHINPGVQLVLVFFLPFHPSILEPNLNLSLTETKCVSNFNPPPSSQISIEMEFLFQFQCLVSSVSLSSPFPLCNRIKGRLEQRRWNETKDADEEGWVFAIKGRVCSAIFELNLVARVECEHNRPALLESRTGSVHRLITDASFAASGDWVTAQRKWKRGGVEFFPKPVLRQRRLLCSFIHHQRTLRYSLARSNFIFALSRNKFQASSPLSSLD